MGQKSTYKCSNCDYTVLTSGQTDMGMLAVTDTFMCMTCREIVDVTIGQYGQAHSKEEIAALDADEVAKMQYYTCPECGSGDHLVKWDVDGKPCPRCDGQLEVDPKGPSMLWD